MNKSDVIEEMKSVILSNDVLIRIMNYYGIKNDGKSKCICCFHNDKQYGNAFFGKIQGKFRCFKCAKTFDAFDIVSIMEPGLSSFYEKVCFIYENILGMPVPSYEKERDFLTYKELSAIGIYHASGGYIKCPSGIIFRMDETTLEKGEADEDGYCVVYKKQRANSLYEMFKEDPQSILKILEDKSIETINSISEKIDITYDKRTSTGRFCAEFPKSAQEHRDELRNMRREAIDVRKKILYLKKKNQ